MLINDIVSFEQMGPVNRFKYVVGTTYKHLSAYNNLWFQGEVRKILILLLSLSSVSAGLS